MMSAQRAKRGSLTMLSVGELRTELARRQRWVQQLQKRRAALLKQIASIDAQIGRDGGAVGAARPVNRQGLVESLRGVLAGKTMSVGEALAAVQKAGYRTNARHFRVIVNATLLKKKFFRRVGRGQYTAV